MSDENVPVVRIELPERLMEILEEMTAHLEVIASNIGEWAEGWANPAVSIEKIKATEPKELKRYPFRL